MKKQIPMKLTAAIVAILAAFVAMLAVTPFAKSAESMFLKVAYGAKVFHRSSEIILVEVDDRSIAEFGPWPWQGRQFQTLIDALSTMRPGLIAISSEITSALATPEGKISPRVEMPPIVAGFELLSSLADLPLAAEKKAKNPPISQATTEVEKLAFAAVPSDDSALPSAAAIKRDDLPQNVFARAAEGYSTIVAGPDELVISQPLAVRFKGLILPSFAVSAAAKWLGFSPLISEDSSQKPSGIKIGELEIRTGANLEIALSLRGPSRTFPRVSAADIMTGKTLPETLAGRLAILSLTAAPKSQKHRTTLGTMDDGEIQANLIDNVLHARSMAVLTTGVSGALFVIFFVLAFAASISIVHMKRTVASMLALICIAWTAGIVALYSYGIWLPVIETSLALLFAGVALSIWKIFKYDMPRKMIASEMSWRLDPASISELAIKRVKLSVPKQHEVTALCFDMRGYGRVVESLDDERIFQFTGELRALTGNIINRHGGFINTWTGDECRAVFGAPLEIAEPKLRACLAALEINRALSSVPAWKDKYGLNAVAIAIGVHTGRASSGWSGHSYEVIGPAVEAAARLSSMSRLYRTWALLGESTAADVESTFEFRRLDNAMLYGSESPQGIYELVGEAGALLPASRGFAEAMSAYLGGDFEKAKELFERILKYHPDDGPSRLFLRRSTFLATHRPAKWDGVWKF